MKRIRILSNWRCRRVTRPDKAAPTEGRRGSTIIVVLALVSMLMVLGFLFFTLASQEGVSSQNFSDALKGSPTNFDYFEWTNRQLILGADASEGQSALYGGRHSLLATLFGRDAQPFSGEGVNLAWNPGVGLPVLDRDYNSATQEQSPVDSNGDGTNEPDYLHPFLEVNLSPAARAQLLPGFFDPSRVNGVGMSVYPAPDADHTYPDHNNVFLSYDARIPNGAGGTLQVIIPSFLGPQLLRNLREDADGDGTPDPGEDANGNGSINDVLRHDQWYSHITTARRMLRPHKEHRAVAADGSPTNIRRFVSDVYPDATLAAFPFPTQANPLQMGVWSGHTEDTPPNGNGDGVLQPGEDLNGNGLIDFVYDLDADPDNDGVNDAIWMDLGFPVRISPNGTPHVAMAAVTIKDADGLFNLNAHGNLAARFSRGPNDILGDFDDDLSLVRTRAGQVFGFDLVSGNIRPLSRSNQGTTPAEVNPQLGLYAAAGTSNQFLRYYGHQPNNFSEQANMEWWWHLTGRPQYDNTGNITDLYPGRYGEVELLSNAVPSGATFSFPAPGETFAALPLPGAFNPFDPSHTDADDNNNRHEGGQFVDNANQANRTFPPIVQFPQFRHPLDFRGTGLAVNTNNFIQPLMATLGRHQWPAYSNYLVHPNINYPLAPPPGFPVSLQSYLLDEPGEMTAEPKLDDANDNLYPAGQNVIHLSNADLNARNLFGNRIFENIPINFDRNNNDPLGSLQRRRQFATSSWDLKSWGKSFYGLGAGANKFRRWEFSADWDRDGRLEFPPSFPSFQFTTLGTFPSTTPQDPFRSELRELLMIEASSPTDVVIGSGDSTRRKVQRRLSINGVLDREPPPQNNQPVRLRFRPLTPHPTGIGANPVTQQILAAGKTFPYSNGPLPEFPEEISNAVEQEYMARRDRQLMARDIYVLLYTLGGGNDSGGSAQYNGDNSARNLYSNEEMQTMAQFAVNVVDALDRDSYITRFEYDRNLVDGWSLDDNPYTTGDGAADRGFVYGVEEQTLTLSEVMAFKTLQLAGNEDATEYDDSTQEHYFSFMELRNVSPDPVQFDNAVWRIRIEPVVQGGAPLDERSLVLGPLSEPAGNGVPSGGLFSIGTANDNTIIDTTGTNQPYSFFKVDPQWTSGTPDFTLPRTFIAPPVDQIGLDLIRRLALGSTINWYWVTDNAGADVSATPGAFLTEVVTAGTTGIVLSEIRFILERRANPDRPQPTDFLNSNPQNNDNPWVEVDRMVMLANNASGNVVPLEFGLPSPPTTAQITQELQDIESLLKRQPLDGRTNGRNGVDWANGYQGDVNKQNSLGFENDNHPSPVNPANPFTLWQPHFDRDFESVVELFNIPVKSARNLQATLASATNANQFEELSTAGGRFFNPAYPIYIPDDTDPDPNPNAHPNRENRWYRVLEFLEIPEKGEKYVVDDTGRSNDDYTPWHTTDVGRIHNADGPNPQLRTYRRAGRINPNTLRHASVLGGILDDQILAINRDPTTNEPVGVTGNGRNMWQDFLLARDGMDPLPIAQGGTNNGAFGLTLPGVPFNSASPPLNQQGSRPFRSLGFSQRTLAATTDASLEDTILRSSPTVANTGLFELTGGGNAVAIDTATRQRLLSKIYNNITTRSNVFIVFIQIDFFEAGQVQGTNLRTGQNEQVWRIGAQLFDSPGMRGFFVIDRSKGMEAIRSQFIPQVWVDAGGNRRFTDSFYWNGVNRRVNPPQNVHQPLDFRPMILHKEIIVDNN